MRKFNRKTKENDERFLTVSIAGIHHKKDIHAIRQFVKNNYPGEVKLRTPATKAFLDPAVAAEFLSKAAMLAAALVSLFMSMRQLRKETEWTYERIESLILSECAKLGLVDIQILAINDFENLTKKSREPCKVIAKSKLTQERITIYIFYNGRSYSMKVKQN